MADIIRVLRLIEYEGPREFVEEQVANSLHGTRFGMAGKPLEVGLLPPGRVRITAVTLGTYPEVIEIARRVPAPGEMEFLLEDNRRLYAKLREIEGIKEAV